MVDSIAEQGHCRGCGDKLRRPRRARLSRSARDRRRRRARAGKRGLLDPARTRAQVSQRRTLLFASGRDDHDEADEAAQAATSRGEPPVVIRPPIDDGAARTRRTPDPDAPARGSSIQTARAPTATTVTNGSTCANGRNGRGEAGEAAGSPRNAYGEPRVVVRPVTDVRGRPRPRPRARRRPRNPRNCARP